MQNLKALVRTHTHTNTQTHTHLHEGGEQQRALLDLGDAAAVVKVLLGHGVTELVKLNHVCFVDHAVTEHTLHLMHPQACNLRVCVIVVCVRVCA